VTGDIASLEHQLNDFDPDVRRDALNGIASALAEGAVSASPPTGDINVHLHTFFSFNAADWSPSRIVWEAKKIGLDVVGSVDFDVLDAMPEMFEAGDVLGVRTVAALETRTFIEQHSDKVFCSPGEPGVAYFMGTGFTRLPGPETAAATALSAMRAQAAARNVAMLERISPAVGALDIDYDADVIPLTPKGNATERHMLAALDDRARRMFPEPDRLAAFWAGALATDAAKIKPILDDTPALRNAIRATLMKRGGIGYVQPDEKTFPPIADVIEMILECRAIPCFTWLDGTSAGEADPEWLADFSLELGCLAVNIIPDRNWNISDPATKKLKVRKLGEIVEAIRSRDLIFSIGTEMNSYGQRFVDDFRSTELAPFADDFRDGALILYGHTLLQRALGIGRTSDWARDRFGDDRRAANSFYLAIGRKGFPPRQAREALSKLGDEPCDVEDVRKALGQTSKR